uniref:Uncharacterized protein n=1 Tax=Mycena chlorophos TaxID=658473 RepID=A0ABQ0L5B5_MYCCL|nr:predicted protein [Mycena chlorophos]
MSPAQPRSLAPRPSRPPPSGQRPSQDDQQPRPPAAAEPRRPSQSALKRPTTSSPIHLSATASHTAPAHKTTTTRHGALQLPRRKPPALTYVSEAITPTQAPANAHTASPALLRYAACDDSALNISANHQTTTHQNPLPPTCTTTNRQSAPSSARLRVFNRTCTSSDLDALAPCAAQHAQHPCCVDAAQPSPATAIPSGVRAWRRAVNGSM